MKLLERLRRLNEDDKKAARRLRASRRHRLDIRDEERDERLERDFPSAQVGTKWLPFW